MRQACTKHANLLKKNCPIGFLYGFFNILGSGRIYVVFTFFSGEIRWFYMSMKRFLPKLCVMNKHTKLQVWLIIAHEYAQLCIIYFNKIHKNHEDLNDHFPVLKQRKIRKSERKKAR